MQNMYFNTIHWKVDFSKQSSKSP